MKVKKTAIILGCLILVLALGVTPGFAKVKFITITSGPVGGTYYILGGALADLLKDVVPEAKVTVTTGGSLANISKVQGGKADLGFTMDSLVNEARQGIEAYKDKGKHDKVLGLTYICDIYMSLFLLPQDSPIKSIDEIREKKIPIRALTSPRASSPSVAAERMLGAYGITFKDIESWGGKVNFVSYAEASSLLKDGHADIWVGPITPPLLEVTTTKKMKLLPIKQEVLKTLKQEFKYGMAMIPKGYWEFIHEDTPTMTEAIMIIVAKDLPEDVVYNITKSIASHPDVVRNVHRMYKDYDPKKGCEFSGTPMHPGALKYFKEQGICK